MQSRTLFRKVFLFRLVPIFLSSLLIGGSVAYAFPSDWAKTEVEMALELGFVPDEISHEYQENISRIDFCSIALNFIGFQYGFASANKEEAQFPIDVYCKYHLRSDGLPYSVSDYSQECRSWQELLIKEKYNFFSDFPAFDIAKEYTAEELYIAVEHPTIATKAAIIGIMGGRGNGIFDPYSPISRQEAATVLARVYHAYDGSIPDNVSLEYSDTELIEEWAFDSVSLMTTMGIMCGTENEQFDPLGFYTVEQCISTFYRLYINAPNSRLKRNIAVLRTPEVTWQESQPGSWADYVLLWEKEIEEGKIVFGHADIVSGRSVNGYFMAFIDRAGGIYWIDVPWFSEVLDFEWDEEHCQLIIRGAYSEFEIYSWKVEPLTGKTVELFEI